MAGGLALTSTATQFFRALVLWPVWWYSKGLIWALEMGKRLTVYVSRQLAVGVWVKNLFVPMFGLHDWQSRLISIFMRGLQIIARSFALLMWLLAVLLFACLYLLLPVLSIGFLIYHLGAFV